MRIKSWYRVFAIFLLGLSLVTSPFTTFVEGQTAAKSETDLNPVNSWINWRESVELLTTYSGATGLVEALEQKLALPLSLAAGDFDEDGTLDVVSGYVAASGGILAVHRGLGPLSVVRGQLQQTTDNGQLTTDAPPFLHEARVFEVEAAPDFLGAGGFDGDDHADVVAAAQGSDALYLMRGDGRGNLGVAERLELPGAVTALAVGDLDEDDKVDLAVAMGSELLIVRDLPQAISDFGFRMSDCGLKSELSNPTSESFSFPFTVMSLALGDFIWDKKHRLDIALLGDDGEVQLLSSEDGNDDAGGHRGPPRQEVATVSVGATVSGCPRLISAKLSGLPTDDLILLDQSNGKLHTFTTHYEQLTADNGPLTPVSLDVAGLPVAVLPMRWDGDERDDLVILKDGGASFLAIALTDARTRFSVNRSGDAFDPTTAGPNPIGSLSRLAVDDLALQQPTNLSRLSNVIANASSSFSGYPADRIKDGDLNTSWFSACGDSANQGRSPWAEVVLPTDSTVNQINLRGNRQFADGYDIFAGRIEVFDAQGRTLLTRKEKDDQKSSEFSLEAALQREVNKEAGWKPALPGTFTGGKRK